MTLGDALDLVSRAWAEDDQRETLVDALVPVLLDEVGLLYLLNHAWTDRADEIREVLTEYLAASIGPSPGRYPNGY